MTPMVASSADDSAPAVFDAATGTWTTYGELRRAVDQVALSFGDSRKQLVLLSAGHALSTVVNYLAVLAAGHAVMVCDSQLSPEWRRGLVEAYSPDWILGGAELGETFSGYVSVPSNADCVAHRLLPQRETPPIHPDLSVLLSTSGTTGSSKYVRLSARNITANAASIAAVLDIRPDDRALLVLPLHYSYGLSVVNSHLCAGASLVLTSASLMEKQLWDVAASASASSMACVPFQIQLLRKLGSHRIGQSAIRTLTQAGGRLAADLAIWGHDTMEALGGRFFMMYGQTEATARISVIQHTEILQRPTSVGRAIPGGALSISGDPTQAPIGEVVYRGPNVMMGYAASREDLARGDECGGALHTGDLGYIDADGYLVLTGRAKRMIKLAGKRVNLDEVEKLLQGDVAIAAVGRDDQLRLFCEVDAGSEMTRSLVIRAARLLGVPVGSVRVQAVDTLPHLSNGKIDYESLQGRP